MPKSNNVQSLSSANKSRQTSPYSGPKKTVNSPEGKHFKSVLVERYHYFSHSQVTKLFHRDQTCTSSRLTYLVDNIDWFNDKRFIFSPDYIFGLLKGSQGIYATANIKKSFELLEHFFRQAVAASNTSDGVSPTTLTSTSEESEVLESSDSPKSEQNQSLICSDMEKKSYAEESDFDYDCILESTETSSFCPFLTEEDGKRAKVELQESLDKLDETLQKNTLLSPSYINQCQSEYYFFNHMEYPQQDSPASKNKDLWLPENYPSL